MLDERHRRDLEVVHVALTECAPNASLPASRPASLPRWLYADIQRRIRQILVEDAADRALDHFHRGGEATLRGPRRRLIDLGAPRPGGPDAGVPGGERCPRCGGWGPT